MSHTLLAVLGATLVDANFRRSLTRKGKKSAKAANGDRCAALRARGFFLTRGECEIFERMMESFESGRLDETCMKMQVECPNWPCGFFTFD